MIRQQKEKKNSNNPDCSKCGLPLQLRDQQVQLQALAQNLFKVQEEERQWFSRELHDEMGQWLTAVYAEAEAISNSEKTDSSILQGAQSIKDSVNKMHDVIHGMMHELRPALLDTLGLTDSLHDLRERWCSHNPDISCNLVLEGECNNVDDIIGITIYRIVQEALNNISIHAGANRVLIKLSQKVEMFTNSDILLLNIDDNGKGFNPDQQSHGFGLLGMYERADAIGGEFSLYSEPGRGTQIKAKFPT